MIEEIPHHIISAHSLNQGLVRVSNDTASLDDWNARYYPSDNRMWNTRSLNVSYDGALSMNIISPKQSGLYRVVYSCGTGTTYVRDTYLKITGT